MKFSNLFTKIYLTFMDGQCRLINVSTYNVDKSQPESMIMYVKQYEIAGFQGLIYRMFQCIVNIKDIVSVPYFHSEDRTAAKI